VESDEGKVAEHPQPLASIRAAASEVVFEQPPPHELQAFEQPQELEELQELRP